MTGPEGPGEQLRCLAGATAHLLRDVDGLSDADVARPSLLPRWTRAHVLAHLAQNADGGTRLLGWARTGVPSYEYESLEARTAAIDAGARAPASHLIREVRRACDAFAAAATGMPAEAWRRVVRYTAGQEPRAEVIVPSRLTEVLVHHVDLDLAYRPRDWPAWFTHHLLTRGTAALTRRGGVTGAVRLLATDTRAEYELGAAGPHDPVVSGAGSDLTAWLYGRSDGRRLSRSPDGPLPPVPAIY